MFAFTRLRVIVDGETEMKILKLAAMLTFASTLAACEPMHYANIAPSPVPSWHDDGVVVPKVGVGDGPTIPLHGPYVPPPNQCHYDAEGKPINCTTPDNPGIVEGI